MRPWGGGGRSSSLLAPNHQVCWCDREAHPPAWERAVGHPGGPRGCARRHRLPAGAGCLRGPGPSRRLAASRPAACQLMGAACGEAQLTGTGLPAAGPWRSSAACRPGSHVAGRTYRPRSAWQRPPVLGSQPPRCAPCPPASQCPGSASSRLLPPALSQLQKPRSRWEGGHAISEREARGSAGDSGITAPPAWAGMGAHRSAAIASREGTSFPPSALCFMPQRRREPAPCQAGGMSCMGRKCSLSTAVPGIVSWSLLSLLRAEWYCC